MASAFFFMAFLLSPFNVRKLLNVLYKIIVKTMYIDYHFDGGYRYVCCYHHGTTEESQALP